MLADGDIELDLMPVVITGGSVEGTAPATSPVKVILPVLLVVALIVIVATSSGARRSYAGFKRRRRRSRR